MQTSILGAEIELVGRREELDTLAKWLPSGRPILILGEDGVGKTRLINDLLANHKNKLFWPNNLTLKDGLTHLIEQCYASIGLESRTLHDLTNFWTVSKNISSMIVRGQPLSWKKLANGIARMDTTKKRKLLLNSLQGQKDVLIIADGKDFTPTMINLLIELMGYCQMIVSLPTQVTKHKKFQRLIQVFPLQLELKPLSLSDSKKLIENFIKEKKIVFESEFDRIAATDYIVAKSERMPKALLDLLKLLAENNLDFSNVYEIDSDMTGIVVCLTPLLFLFGFIGLGYSRVVRYMDANTEHMIWALIIGLCFFGAAYLLRGK